MTDIVYSAYNAAPADLASDVEAENAWYGRLRAEERIGGLELAVFRGGLHPAGLDRLVDLLHPRWSNTVSAMSMTLGAVAADADYGLASRQGAGRARALEDIDRAREVTLGLRDRLGFRSVRGFAVQSAPRADRASVEAFSDSLAQLASWDWHGVELLVEHSDALIAGRAAQKGYLALDDEIAAVRDAASGRTAIRHLLNWGRSAIEGRCGATPARHVELVGAGLGAFAFSGASPQATGRSAAWEDVHLGLAEQEPASLLDAAGVASIRQTLPPGLSYVGVKTGAPVDSTGLNRLDLGYALLDQLD